ncbi:Phage P22-like portal protein [uncultured Caudovirales phage]|uniref:Phage P22-like portal protein n=1 Tax=uncultured Caudovirales phage TaxID=2100421 RepID=A0A6J7X7E2_9CAUD|nr:Phage P22-like portal protein [uncultured Caudovirales phage]CAB5225482.1 Phage P22-like portal protein [uncultured Caudovirales phage]
MATINQDPSGIRSAGKVAARGGTDATDSRDTLQMMRDRFKQALSCYAESREDELDDLRFMAGSPDNQWQWPQDVLATRGSVQGQTVNARPCLTINKLPQHVRQVTNEQRQNRPSGKVIPVNDQADIEVAEVLDGIVRHIEYMSDADVAYDTACENQVTYGEGYIRLLTEYCYEDSFDQDIKIARVRNSFSVYMDPLIQDPCGADAEWCFITEDMTKEEYQRLYPTASPVSTIMAQGIGDQDISQWITDDTIRIAEYFYIDHKPDTLYLYPGNQTAFKNSPEDRSMRAMGLTPLRERSVDRKRIMWMKTNGFEVLEEREWAGKWIPVIRVIGNEFQVDGRIFISGIVRNAKDAQRMYNYWTSQEAEMLALAPKAPFIGYGGQFEGYEYQWKTANTQNWPYLEVNPDVTDGSGAVLPLPQRAAPPLPQTGLIQAKMGASEDIKSTTGQYNASLGQVSNERSGRAILARQKESDTGTYHYVDNLARAVRYVTRQLVDLIPKIYDTQRIARIIGVDGETNMVKIDPTQPEPVKKIVDQTGIVIDKIYNPSVGRYDVVVTTGPSYMTKRQESMEAMSQILQGNPNLWAVAGDLFVKNMDWPGAQEMAARLRKTIDPKLLADQDNDPALQAAQQQIEAMGQEMQQMVAMLQSVNQSMEAQKLDIDRFKAETDAEVKSYEAETRRLQAVAAGMQPEQVQEVVMQTLRDVMTAGDMAIAGRMEMPEQATPAQEMPQ